MQFSSFRKLIYGVGFLMFFSACMVSKQNSLREPLMRFNGKNITKIKQWEKKKKQVLVHMQQAMGPLPKLTANPPFKTRVLDSVISPSYIRFTIQFTVAAGEDVSALLYVPTDYLRKTNIPAMIALHGTDKLGKLSVAGQSELANRDYARKLAERGYVVLAPDYPGFGDLRNYDFDADRYQSGTMKGIFNHMRSVDYLESLSYVDSSKIGVIGHSLGGHNAIFLGAFDPRVKVVIASCGWTLLPYYDVGPAMEAQYGGKLGPWAQKLYMPLLKEKYQLDPHRIPFDFDEIIATIAPRIFFTNSPLKDGNFNVEGVKVGLKNIGGIYRLFNKSDALHAAFPDAGHDFPATVTQAAFEVLDRAFK